jgi:hypothetical protein
MHALAPTMPADVRALLESLGVKAQGERPRSERVLERLLDLNRCVALGNVLDQPRRATNATPAPGQPPSLEPLAHDEAQLARLRLLEGRLLTSLRDLRGQIDQRFESATSGARVAPDAEALHAMLTEPPPGDAHTSRKSVATHVAAQVTKRYVAVADAVLELLLKELGRRRRDVQQGLQQGNADMQRLAALDGVLDGIFRGELDVCRVQLATRLGAVLESELHAVCVTFAANPGTTGVDALRPWFAPRGCIGKFQRDARRLCQALLDLEWSALMGLLQAAMQAEAELEADSKAALTSDLEKAEP